MAFTRLADNPSNLAAWHLYIITPRLLLRPIKSVSGARVSFSSSVSCIRSRCFQFLQGEWAELWGLAMAQIAPPSPPRPPTPTLSPLSPSLNPSPSLPPLSPAPPACPLPKAALRRCLRLARVGELSRAIAALNPQAPSPDTEDTLARLHALHPSPPRTLPDWLPSYAVPEETTLSLNPDLFYDSLIRSRCAAAGGPSGLVFDHLRDVYLAQAHTPGAPLTGSLLRFHTVCNHVASGRLPPSIAALLGTSRLIALRKPNWGVRPIAIVEALLRKVSRCEEGSMAE